MSKTESKCSECGGTGVVVLLTSRRECQTCAARNQSVPADSVAPGPEAETSKTDVKESADGWTTTIEYDSLGRVIRKTGGAPIATYFYESRCTSDDFPADAPPPEDGGEN